jgi:hypothetical protein
VSHHRRRRAAQSICGTVRGAVSPKFGGAHRIDRTVGTRATRTSGLASEFAARSRVLAQQIEALPDAPAGEQYVCLGQSLDKFQFEFDALPPFKAARKGQFPRAAPEVTFSITLVSQRGARFIHSELQLIILTSMVTAPAGRPR